MNLLASAAVVLSLFVQGHTRMPASNPTSRAFSDLFTVEQADKQRLRVAFQSVQGRLSAPRPTVERGPCNMPMIRGHATVDPEILVPIERTNADPKIRAIQPSACWQGAQRTGEEVIVKR